MSAWDYEGRYTREEDDGTESDPSRSVLERWHVLNLMHAPGMTDGFYRILGIIAESCPPGNELWKGRKRLAEDAGQSLSNVKKFYSWAYSQGIMERKEGRRGFSDRVWPMYDAWIDHAATTVQRMKDPERRAKEADRLEAFALSLGKDGMWARRFRESMGRAQCNPPRVKSDPGVGHVAVPPLGHNVSPRTGIPNRTFNRKGKQVVENGPEPEQAPLRTSPSSSLPQYPKNEKPKSTAREKERAHILQFFRAELSTGNGVKPLEDYLKWVPPRYGREDIEWAYQEASGFQAGAR